MQVLKLEWSTLDRRWREQKDTDLDGLLFEHEIDDIPEEIEQPDEMLYQDTDDMMVDTIAQEEEAELDAMLSLYEEQSSASASQAPARPQSMSWSDDEDYDSLFQDLLSGKMDMS